MTLHDLFTAIPSLRTEVEAMTARLELVMPCMAAEDEMADDVRDALHNQFLAFCRQRQDIEKTINTVREAGLAVFHEKLVRDLDMLARRRLHRHPGVSEILRKVTTWHEDRWWL